MVGKRLQFGDSFAEIVDTSRAIVDVAIDDTDSAQLRAGEHASVKLNSFPTRIFRGDVMVVSPRGTLQGDSRGVLCPGCGPESYGAIRSGMEGRGKVRVGWYPQPATSCSASHSCGPIHEPGRGLEYEGLESEWLECA